MKLKIINCKKGDKTKYYEKISNSKFFQKDKDLGYPLIFCIAAVIGFNDKNYQEIKKKEWVIRTEYIDSNSNLKTLLQSIAIVAKTSIEILDEEGDIYKIAEGYANGGIKKLYSMVSNINGPDFDKEIELQMNNIMKKSK